MDGAGSIAAMLDSVDDALDRAREEREGLQSVKVSAADALLTGLVRVGVGGRRRRHVIRC